MFRKISFKPVSNEAAIIWSLVIIKLLIHLCNPEYGFHRDELYFMTIGNNFNFNNLDALPFAPLFYRIFTLLLGHSIKVIHLASALCGALSIVLACLITKEFGGKKIAVLITGTCILFSGFMPFGSIATYEATSLVIWMAALYLLVRLFKTGNQKLWISIGLVMGIGLINKLTILFLGSAVFTCLLLVPQRSFFKSRWIWIAGILALLFSIPYLIWQSHHNWYFINFASTYTGNMYKASFFMYIVGQIIPMNIFSFPLWLAGLGMLLIKKEWKQYRFFGLCYLFLFIIFFYTLAPFYFLLPFYAILISAGSVELEKYFIRRKEKNPHSYNYVYLLIAINIITNIPLFPLSIPLLPVETMIKYSALIGIDAGIKTNNSRQTRLPQHVADRMGWQEMAYDVAAVYHSAAADKSDPGIITNNWGEASAINYYRDKFNLPQPVSTDGWFYYEVLNKPTIKNAYVSIGIPQSKLITVFNKVELKAIHTNQYCMPQETDLPIYLCSGPRFDLLKYWVVIHNMDKHFESFIKHNDITGAINYYHRMKEKDSSTIMFTEEQINFWGYKFLQDKKFNDAIALFLLNVEVFPQSFNVYDSLAEAYMLSGNVILAKKYYEKSLLINSGNLNAKNKLKALNHG